MVALIGVAASASVLSFGVYFSQFLTLAHVSYGRPTLLVTSVSALVICWFLSRVGARLAAWAMFVTEIVATLAMFVVFVALIVNHRGPIIDTRQIHLQNVSLSVVLTAVVLGVGGFGGFESAAVYGQEATRPRRVIPVAMVISVAIAGIVWMLSSYMLFLGFRTRLSPWPNRLLPWARWRRSPVSAPTATWLTSPWPSPSGRHSLPRSAGWPG